MAASESKIPMKVGSPCWIHVLGESPYDEAGLWRGEVVECKPYISDYGEDKGQIKWYYIRAKFTDARMQAYDEARPYVSSWDRKLGAQPRGDWSYYVYPRGVDASIDSLAERYIYLRKDRDDTISALRARVRHLENVLVLYAQSSRDLPTILLKELQNPEFRDKVFSLPEFAHVAAQKMIHNPTFRDEVMRHSDFVPAMAQRIAKDYELRQRIVRDTDAVLALAETPEVQRAVEYLNERKGK